MKKILVASKNPVKINAALAGFQQMFPDDLFEIDGISVPSDVNDQPRDDAETMDGAWNRIRNLRTARSDGDFYVSIEGGIEERGAEIEAFAWVLVQTKDDRVGRGRTGAFYLPPKIAALIRQGKELGDAADAVFNETNSKQNQGSIGLLTNGIIDRTAYYVDAVVFALIPFRNEALYFPD